MEEIEAARQDDQQADVERKEAGPRTLRAPSDADPQAAYNHDDAEERNDRGNADLNPPVGRTCPASLHIPAHETLARPLKNEGAGGTRPPALDRQLVARKPASFISV